MTANFNLLDKPWLPVVLADGTEKQVGIREALLSASAFRELRDESPVVTAALHRLLLAILHRALSGPGSLKQWRVLWERGQFDDGALQKYLDQWQPRFDLFDESRPFFQVAEMPAEIEPSSVKRLAAELANGGAASPLFNHDAAAASLTVPAGVAARWLVAQQAAALGGTIGAGRGNFFDAPIARGAIFLIEGKDLFQTLLMNLVPYDDARPIPRIDDDAPAWERPYGIVRHVSPKTPVRRPPNGYVDYLTWQSRAIRLHPPAALGDGVELCKFFDGETLTASSIDIDPMMAYFRDPKNEKTPISSFRIAPGRALWRDCDSMLTLGLKTTVATWRQPAAVEMLAKLSRDGFPKTARLRVCAFGWAANQAKVDLWRQERLSLPGEYLLDNELVADLKVALAMAEAVVGALRSSVRASAKAALSPADPNKADKDRSSTLVESLAPDRVYWSGLETEFRAMLSDLPGAVAHRLELLRHWFSETLCGAAWRAFRRTAGTLESSARAHRAAVEGEAALRRLLRQLKHKDFAGIFPVDASQLQEASDAKS